MLKFISRAGAAGMPDLAALQTMMSAALRGRAGDEAELRPLLLTRGVSAASVIEVARNNVVATLVNALRASFPAVGRLVGPEFFDAAATAFARAAPPRSPWLDGYGGGFPAFLSTYTALSALPYVAAVAELEWLVNVALHAHDAGACELAALAALDDEAAGRVRFQAAPSFGLMRADVPVDAIWSAVLELDRHDGETNGAERAARLAAIDLQAGPVWLCVSRPAHGVDVRRLPEEAWRFAATLRAGIALETAASCVKGDVGALLACHLRQGHFTCFSLAT